MSNVTELDVFDKILQLGFAAVVALLMIYIVWKLGHKGIEKFESMNESHKGDMKEMAQLHRQERKECYAAHEKQVDKFDETIRMFSGKLRQ